MKKEREYISSSCAHSSFYTVCVCVWESKYKYVAKTQWNTREKNFRVCTKYLTCFAFALI